MTEGAYILETAGIGEHENPRVDPFSFGIWTHVWTTDEIVYKFETYLKSARHLITKARQRTLMKRAFDTWLPHIGRSATRAGDDAPWSAVDIVVLKRDIGSFTDVAQAPGPRSVREPREDSNEKAPDEKTKSTLEWNTKGYVIDREAAYEMFWGDLPAAYLGAAYAIGVGGGLIGAAIWAIFGASGISVGDRESIAGGARPWFDSFACTTASCTRRFLA